LRQGLVRKSLTEQRAVSRVIVVRTAVVSILLFAVVLGVGRVLISTQQHAHSQRSIAFAKAVLTDIFTETHVLGPLVADGESDRSRLNALADEWASMSDSVSPERVWIRDHRTSGNDGVAGGEREADRLIAAAVVGPPRSELWAITADGSFVVVDGMGALPQDLVLVYSRAAE
jgi:hypothetical protein